MHFIFKSYLHNFYAIFPRYLRNICQILPDITIIQKLVLTGSPKILKFSAEMEKRVHAQECSLQEVGVPPSARVQRWRGQRFWCAGVVVDPELLLFGNEVTTATMMMMMMTIITTIRINHILQFCHQYLRFKRVAVFSNWRAPSWRASARVSRSVSFWSRSKTFSTFTLIMSTTSSTCAWVCCSLLLGCAPPAGWAPLGCGGGAEGPAPGAAVAIFRYSVRRLKVAKKFKICCQKLLT